MPAGVSEPCSWDGSSAGLVRDHQPPAPRIPGPAAAWRSMGMPCCRSWRGSLVFPALLGRGWITGQWVGCFGGGFVQLVRAPGFLLGSA